MNQYTVGGGEIISPLKTTNEMGGGRTVLPPNRVTVTPLKSTMVDFLPRPCGNKSSVQGLARNLGIGERGCRFDTPNPGKY